jgi:hypothetical protein
MRADDAKLVTLARGARRRTDAGAGAALRDDAGRTYSGTDMSLPSLSLTAVQLAVAQAAAAGARGVEAVVVVSDAPVVEEASLTCVRDLGGPGVAYLLCDARGAVVEEITT